MILSDHVFSIKAWSRDEVHSNGLSFAIKMFYFIFSGLSLLTLVIVCVAEPNLEELLTTETTQTREGKSKCEMIWFDCNNSIINVKCAYSLSFSSTSLPSDQISCKLKGNYFQYFSKVCDKSKKCFNLA